MDSISRHEQLLRVFHLIDVLFGARRPLSIAEMKTFLRDRGVIEEMSDKNIRRDIEFLGKFGYAVKSSRKRSDRGGSCLAFEIMPGRGKEELHPPAVSLLELLSLAVARDFLAPLAGTFYWRGIGQLLAKLEKVATPELLAYVNEHKDGLVIHPRPAAVKYRTRTLNAINRAIRAAVELEIDYQGLADAKPRRSVIRPQALVLYDGSIYIAASKAPAATRKRGDSTRRPTHDAHGDAASAPLRFYKLDRVSDARPTSRTFARQQASVETLLADSITIYRSDEPPRRYRLRVDPARARWAVEKPFHPRQRVWPQKDGGVILDIERAWDDEMIPQLLGLADCVEVLEPEDIRDRLLDIARRIAARYVCRHVAEFDAIRAECETMDFS